MKEQNSRPIGWKALRSPADKYIMPKITPDMAQELLQKWQSGDFSTDDCTEFTAQMMELIETELRLWRA